MKFTYGMVRSFVVARQLAARARLFQGGKFSGFFCKPRRNKISAPSVLFLLWYFMLI